MLKPALLCLVGLSGALLAQETTPSAPGPAGVVPTPPAPSVAKASVTKVGDEGLLEFAYFGAELGMQKAHQADHFWIKPGLSLKGRTLASRPWEVKMLNRARSPQDTDRAAGLSRLLSETLLSAFQKAFQGHSTWQVGGGADYLLEGRVVDANVPNTASKLVFGWLGGKNNLENTTYDLKLVEAASGETVLAVHHRMVKVNTLGSLDNSLRSWTKDFAAELRTLAP